MAVWSSDPFVRFPCPPPKWRVVHDVMFVCGPIAKVMNPKIDNFIFLRAFHHALVERRATDFWKECDDVDAH